MNVVRGLIAATVLAATPLLPITADAAPEAVAAPQIVSACQPIVRSGNTYSVRCGIVGPSNAYAIVARYRSYYGNYGTVRGNICTYPNCRSAATIPPGATGLGAYVVKG